MGIDALTHLVSFSYRKQELLRELVKSFHDHEPAGHSGEIGTYNAVWQHYWWPGLCTFVKNYIQGCGACQQFKINWSPSKPAYIPTEGVESLWPFANCSMDLITDLTLADGFDSILVMVDQGLLKGVILMLLIWHVLVQVQMPLILAFYFSN